MAKYRITNDAKQVIVNLLKEHKIPYWELAEKMGIHENTVAKRMRKPTQEQAEEIMSAIYEIIGDDR